MRAQNDSIAGCLFRATPNAFGCIVPYRFFLTTDWIAMYPIQNTHIAAMSKLGACQLEALRIPADIAKEYFKILVLREKIKLATDLKAALYSVLPRA